MICSIAPDVLLGVALGNSDNHAIIVCLNQVAVAIFIDKLGGIFAKVTGQLLDSSRSEIANDPAMAIKFLVTVRNQHVADDWWDATLL